MQVLVGKKLQWIRLGREESVTIHPGPSLKKLRVLGLLVKDWRGVKQKLGLHLSYHQVLKNAG